MEDFVVILELEVFSNIFEYFSVLLEKWEYLFCIFKDVDFDLVKLFVLFFYVFCWFWGDFNVCGIVEFIIVM